MKKERRARIRLVEGGSADARLTATHETHAGHAAELRAQAHARVTARRRGLALAPATRRRHTLIPTGSLHGLTAPILEAEIERYEREVSSLTLDLRELASIDRMGISVIAFRCRLGEKRGVPVTVIPGSRLMRRTLEEAGIAWALADDEEPTSGSLEPPARARRGPRRRADG